MNEQTMIWFLQKTTRYQLSREAVMLWMDCYAYLQNQNRACTPQIRFSQLYEICDLEREAMGSACRELVEAGMLRFSVIDAGVFCQLVAERLYRTPDTTAG